MTSGTTTKTELRSNLDEKDNANLALNERLLVFGKLYEDYQNFYKIESDLLIPLYKYLFTLNGFGVILLLGSSSPFFKSEFTFDWRWLILAAVLFFVGLFLSTISIYGGHRIARLVQRKRVHEWRLIDGDSSEGYISAFMQYRGGIGSIDDPDKAYCDARKRLKGFVYVYRWGMWGSLSMFTSGSGVTLFLFIQAIPTGAP